MRKRAETGKKGRGHEVDRVSGKIDLKTEIEGRKLRLFVTQNSEERMRRRRSEKLSREKGIRLILE